MIGPIRQEILSGIQNQNQFEILKQQLTAFPDLELETEDFEKAAEFFNINRRKGVQGSNTDFLTCAVAHRRGLAILALDKDFALFSKYLPIKLHIPRSIAS